jgi:hypothetical protein
MTEAHLQTFRFPELKRHAILLSLGEDPSSTTQVDVDTYKVAFVYTDVDGDKAMIASDSDLEEAILQFNKKGSVKVFASVDENKVEKAPSRESATTQTVHSAADSTTQTAHSPATAYPSSSATHTARTSATTFDSSSANAAASRRSQHKAPKQLQEVVESFVNAIATAVITVTDQIQAPPNTATATQANTTPADTTPVPFIHGRHTCDGCLTTPIVGTRFQAINLPDYDLCAQCKHNYKGSEIKFQAVELDRDRPFQERWQRRQAKMASGRPVRNGGCRHQRNPRGAHGPNRGRRCGGGGGGRFAPQQSPQGPPVDIAVAEAIRRSLEDAKKAEEKKKQADAVTQTLESTVQQEEKATQSEACTETVTTEETSCEEEEQAGNLDEQESDDETTDSMPNLLAANGYYETTDSMPKLPGATGCQLYAPKFTPFKTTEETACEEKQTGVADEQESDNESDDSMPRLTPRAVPKVSPVKTACKGDEAGVADEQESDDERDDSMPRLLGGSSDEKESDCDDTVPELVDGGGHLHYHKASPVKSSVPKEVEIVSKGDADSSFASDAEGSGEIAAVLGETLDRVARAIDDMHLEFDRTMEKELELVVEKEIVVEVVKDKKGIDEDEGSNISQFAQDDDCDSWNMVADDDN